jgi:hypothetical protein
MYEIFVAKIEIVHFGDVTFATGKDWFLLLAQMTQQQLMNQEKNFISC